MRARLLSASLLLLIVAVPGCSGGSWGKAATEKDQMRADLAECRRHADALIARDAGIDADIMATRSQDWRRTGTLSTKRTTQTAADQERAQNYVDDCMKARGYHRNS